MSPKSRASEALSVRVSTIATTNLCLRFRRCRCVRDCLTPHPCRKVFKLEPWPPELSLAPVRPGLIIPWLFGVRWTESRPTKWLRIWLEEENRKLALQVSLHCHPTIQLKTQDSKWAEHSGGRELFKTTSWIGGREHQTMVIASPTSSFRRCNSRIIPCRPPSISPLSSALATQRWLKERKKQTPLAQSYTRKTLLTFPKTPSASFQHPASYKQSCDLPASTPLVSPPLAPQQHPSELLAQKISPGVSCHDVGAPADRGISGWLSFRRWK